MKNEIHNQKWKSNLKMKNENQISKIKFENRFLII